MHGRFGHLYEHGDERLGVMFLNLTPRRWNSIRRRWKAVGCEIWQDADGEGSALFDPLNPAQVKTVLKLAGVRPRRTASPKQREQLARMRATALQNRWNHLGEGRSEANFQSEGPGTAPGSSPPESEQLNTSNT